jgi:hypothetical protein
VPHFPRLNASRLVTSASHLNTKARRLSNSIHPSPSVTNAISFLVDVLVDIPTRELRAYRILSWLGWAVASFCAHYHLRRIHLDDDPFILNSYQQAARLCYRRISVETVGLQLLMTCRHFAQLGMAESTRRHQGDRQVAVTSAILPSSPSAKPPASHA